MFEKLSNQRISICYLYIIIYNFLFLKIQVTNKSRNNKQPLNVLRQKIKSLVTKYRDFYLTPFHSLRSFHFVSYHS